MKSFALGLSVLLMVIFLSANQGKSETLKSEKYDLSCESGRLKFPKLDVTCGHDNGTTAKPFCGGTSDDFMTYIIGCSKPGFKLYVWYQDEWRRSFCPGQDTFCQQPPKDQEVGFL